MSQHAGVDELHKHPGPRAYVGVAIILAVVTAIEVAIYYIEALEDFLVVLLIFFSLIKFSLVALWFMHLRFDSRIFRRFFLTGVILALVVFGIVLWYFFAQGGPSPGLGAGGG